VFEEVQGDLYVLQLVEAHAALLPGLGKTRWRPLVAMGDSVVHTHENRQQSEPGLVAEGRDRRERERLLCVHAL
jgi:hypothetical protein